jgi:beta-lactam-binding protein with PASTA domain
VEIPDVRGADVGQAQAYLQGFGFAVAITELPPDQARGLCAGVVSYSSPPKGSYVPAGSFVRLFYRSYHQHGCS